MPARKGGRKETGSVPNDPKYTSPNVDIKAIQQSPGLHHL
jgi:hypothetical protein